jgi:large subunit ribosomal protein L21
MFAVIEVGARQYSVEVNDVIDVEKQAGQEGEEVTLDKVLLVSKDKKIEIGQPYLKDAQVHAVVLKHLKGKKLTSYKYRRRKASHWEKGHRQQLTQLKIKDIKLG